MIAGFRKELRPMLRLAAPLAMAELGWMAMGFVDTVMAGRLGAAAIGAGGLGGMLFFPIVICGTGLLAGMDTLVAQAFGAKDDAALPPHVWSRDVDRAGRHAGGRAAAGAHHSPAARDRHQSSK